MSPHHRRGSRYLALSVIFVAGAALAWAVVARNVIVAALAALSVVAAGLFVARVAAREPLDVGRRRFLGLAALVGVGTAAGAPLVVRVVERLAASDDRDRLDAMARSLGRDALRSLTRGYHLERSGDLQLVLAPFNTANYPHESRSLSARDPRSSHALVWGYTDRVPLVVWGPGLVEPLVRDDEVTLADLAPTTAHLAGARFEAPDGMVLPGISRPSTPPRVIVTLVIDGGGWNVLQLWPRAWPNLARLMRSGTTYRNARMGSFPNVTASAHATIGTGAFPRTHGISGHHLRYRGGIRAAWGSVGQADPRFLQVPTLADVWREETGRRSWLGEIGYQIWHVGMIGAGGGPSGGGPPMAVYWDETVSRWASQNPDLYRLPSEVPPPAALADLVRRYFGQASAEVLAEGGRALCCSPPIVRYQGDLVLTTIEREGVGRREATDLLYVNYKAPDYAGHTYNMLAEEERVALEAVDREIGRLVGSLERRFRPGEYALIVTADHGQCPLVEASGGVRLDLLKLAQDLQGPFGWSSRRIVQGIRPSEVFVDPRAVGEGGVSLNELATGLAAYRYGDNIGPYVRDAEIDRARTERPEFAAVLPGEYIAGLTEAMIARAGAGRYPEADPGMPPRAWR
jgi:hypothetical protein